MSYYLKTLLLAGILCVVAHGKTFTFANDAVTSLLRQQQGRGGAKMLAIQAATEKAVAAAAVLAATPGHSLDNLDKTVDKRIPSSAVEDWSLVCQQLCGAALGGAECSPYCKNTPVLPLEEQLKNANNLMDSQKEHLCPNLCGLQLGDEACTCKQWITGNQTKDTPTNVCALFCDYRHVSLAGCRTCAAALAPSPMPIKLMNESIVLDEAVKERGATATATTPNWKQLCAALCKTGDGGSLCNCDLSPFVL